MNDDLGDRMKMYEHIEAGRRLMPLLPVMARIDGRAFHSFTKGMDRPYDAAFSKAMINTTKFLVQETNACIGYTQSDEISLAWHSEDIKTQIWFDGRIQKMTSQLAAQATLAFNIEVQELLEPVYSEKLPTFDARVWNVPNRTEGANVFLWREWDATKNSLSMAAAAYYSHNQLDGKHSGDKHEMLREKGINWNNYPAHFKRGTFVQRKLIKRRYSPSELEVLPEKHAARANPFLEIERSQIAEIVMPPFTSVLNREQVIFEGAEPSCI